LWRDEKAHLKGVLLAATLESKKCPEALELRIELTLEFALAWRPSTDEPKLRVERAVCAR
jgi:hypothetical protein